MSNEYCVYKITNKLNGKIYIGMSKNLKNRWSANGIHYKQSKRFYNAIQKYGWNNFEKIVLVEGLSSVTIKLLKTNEPYKLSRNVNNALKEKFKKLVGLKLEYIQKDNSEV